MKTKDKEQMILDNLGLVGMIAKKYIGTNFEYDDLYQVGCIGLMKAVDEFDATLGFKFSTFAWRLIQNQIFMYMRKQKKHEGHYSLDNFIADDVGGVSFLDNLESSLDTEKRVVEDMQYKHYKDTLRGTKFTELEMECMKRRELGESQQEIAWIIGRSQGMVSKNLRSAKKKVLAMF